MNSVHFWLNVSIILIGAINSAYSKTTVGCINGLDIDEKNDSIEFFCEDKSPSKTKCHSEFIDTPDHWSNSVNAQVKSIKFSSDCYDRNSAIAPTIHWIKIFPNLRAIEVSNSEAAILKQIPFNLNELRLGHNQLTKIDGDTFLHTRQLTELDLSFNKISTIDRTSFSNLTELKILNLSNNLIETLDGYFFVHSLKLEVLKLQNNPVRNGNGLRALLELKHLKHLNISGCNLKNTRLMIMYLPRSLETLDASSNFIGSLTTTLLLTNLKYLNLSHTNLSNLGFDTFRSQNKLEVLDLSYNQLKTVNLTTPSTSSLTTLNLEGNELQNVDAITQDQFGKLALLEISKNRFTCEYIASYLDTKWPNLDSIRSDTHINHDLHDCSHMLSCIQSIDLDSELFANLYIQHVETKRKKNGDCDENLFCLI